jgi:hypothetical protein
MFRAIFLLQLLVTLPTIIASLECYDCPSDFALDYTVTSDTLPLFSSCSLITAEQCSVSIFWAQNPSHTVISLSNSPFPLMNDSLHDVLSTLVQLELNADNVTRITTRDLHYECILSDGCNGGTSLKRLLDSLVLEDKFASELSSLIQNVESFNNNSAATCYRLSNSTDSCAPLDMDGCRRCEISVDQSPSTSNKICATCPLEETDFNSMKRESVFLLNNRSRLSDLVELKCQLNGCNSLDNINKIRQASTVTFDFDKFFQTSSASATSLSISFIFLIALMAIQFPIPY